MILGDDDVLVDDPSVEFPSVVSSCAVGGGGGGHNSHITSSGDIFENDTSIAATNDWTLQPPINVRQPEVVRIQSYLIHTTVLQVFLQFKEFELF